MLVTIIYYVLLGAGAGWIANMLMKKDNSQLGKNIILGIVGAIVGGILLGLIGISTSGIIGNLIGAVIGSCLVIFIAGKIK